MDRPVEEATKPRWVTDPPRPTLEEFMKSVAEGFELIRKDMGRLRPQIIVCSKEDEEKWKRFLNS